MGQDSLSAEAISREQLHRYAQDLVLVYQSERKKTRELAATNAQLVKYAGDLKIIIQELHNTNRQLQEAYLDTIHRLVLAAEYKDEDTGDHIVRMSRYSALLAERYGFGEQEVQDILIAAPMHDVGKIGIPDSILMKPGKLSEEEFTIIRTHPAIGATILAGSSAGILKIAEQIALTHHEKWNGSGYPHGVAGEQIPVVGRIVALADTFDALTSRRPYKDPYPIAVAADIIVKERGRHFDPRLTDLFSDSLQDLVAIKRAVDADLPVVTGYVLSARDSQDIAAS